MAEITDTQIEELAESPQITRTDEGMVQERKVEDMIAADRYINAKNATKPPWGMRIARTKPGGTV